VGALWAQLKRWTQSMRRCATWALRAVRAEVRAAALQCRLETDERCCRARSGDRGAAACRGALESAVEPLAVWFGELGKASRWRRSRRHRRCARLGFGARRAFDRVAVAGGEGGKQAACARSSRSRRGPRFVRPICSRSRGSPARSPPWETTLGELAARQVCPPRNWRGIDHLSGLRTARELLVSVDSLADWAASISLGAPRSSPASGRESA